MSFKGPHYFKVMHLDHGVTWANVHLNAHSRFRFMQYSKGLDDEIYTWANEYGKVEYIPAARSL